jgi:hypothetical protein
MLTGKRFKLDRSTLALRSIEGGRKAVTIPAGAIVKVISGPTGDGDRMVDVLWESQTVTMFAVDVDVRGTEVRDQSATA